MARWCVLVVAVIALGLAACGGGGASAPSSSPPTTRGRAPDPKDHIELRRAVEASVDAQNRGDAAAVFALNSQRCQAHYGSVAALAWVEQQTARWGPQVIVSYHQIVEGDVGDVAYELTEYDLGQRVERWIVEDGAWRSDDCIGAGATGGYDTTP